MHGKWLWFALALVAVFGLTATASGTVQNMITGKQIAPHSITSLHMVNGTLQAHDMSPAFLNSLQGKIGKTGPQGPPGPQGPKGEAAHVLWAKFGEGPPPFLIGNSAATSVERLRTGVFRVTFRQDVGACAYEATLVTAGPIDGAVYNLPKGEVSAGTDFTNGASNPTAVDVQVADSNGNVSDSVGSVALAVFC